MDPQEPRLARLRAVPLERRLDDVLGARLLDVELELLVEVPVELVCRRRSRARGRSASRARTRRRTRPSRSPSPSAAWPRVGIFGDSRKPGVLAHAVLVGEHPRQDVRVRRQRDHVVRVRLREDAPLRGEPVEVGGRAAGVAVEADGVVPQRVDRDEDDVADAAAAPRPAAGAAAGASRRQASAQASARRTQIAFAKPGHRRRKARGPARNSRTGPENTRNEGLEVHLDAQPHDARALHLEDLVEVDARREGAARSPVVCRSVDSAGAPCSLLAALKSSAAGMIVTPPM